MCFHRRIWSFRSHRDDIPKISKRRCPALCGWGSGRPLRTPPLGHPVGISRVPKITSAGSRSLKGGVIYPLQTRPHVTWVTIPNLIAVGQMVRAYDEIRRKIWTRCASPFKVNLGHRNWRRSTLSLWLPINVP